MKQLVLSCFMLLSVFAARASAHINPVIGDQSWVARYGEYPMANADEDLRIRTHLEFVKQLLQHKTTRHLPTALRKKRAQVLHLLGDYIAAGIFPRNFDVPEKRVPCFMDKDSRICAVGYLVARTAGQAVARRINELHKYDAIYAMQEAFILDWMAQHGLTQEECAMIQPAYGTVKQSNLQPAQWIASSVLGGTNVAMCVLNGIEIAHGSDKMMVGIISLSTGIAQSGMGAVLIAQSGALRPSAWLYEDRLYVGCANLGMGLCAVFLGIYNNAHRSKPMKEKRTALNVYSPATAGRKPGLAISMVRTF